MNLRRQFCFNVYYYVPLCLEGVFTSVFCHVFAQDCFSWVTDPSSAEPWLSLHSCCSGFQQKAAKLLKVANKTHTEYVCVCQCYWLQLPERIWRLLFSRYCWLLSNRKKGKCWARGWVDMSFRRKSSWEMTTSFHFLTLMSKPQDKDLVWVWGFCSYSALYLLIRKENGSYSFILPGREFRGVRMEYTPNETLVHFNPPCTHTFTHFFHI